MLKLGETRQIKVIFDAAQSMSVSTQKLNEKGVGGNDVDIWSSIVCTPPVLSASPASAISARSTSANVNDTDLFGKHKIDNGSRSVGSQSQKIEEFSPSKPDFSVAELDGKDLARFQIRHVAQPSVEDLDIASAVDTRDDTNDDTNNDEGVVIYGIGMFSGEAAGQTFVEGEGENSMYGEPGDVDQTPMNNDNDTNDNDINDNHDHVDDESEDDVVNNDEDDRKTDIIYPHKTAGNTPKQKDLMY